MRWFILSALPRRSNRCKNVAIIVTAVLLRTTTTYADTVYSESFNYGAINGSLADQNGGTGFSGAWISGNPGITYAAAGLTFSDLSVSGGSVNATGTDGIGNALFHRALSSTLSGVYYGSFLSQVVNTSLPWISGGMALGSQNSFPGMGGYGILAPANASALGVSAGRPFTQSGSTLTVGQTYLTLFKIDTAAMTTTGWLMSADQFDIFKVGGITDAELNDASLGTGSTQLWARTISTDPAYGPFAPEAPTHLNIYLNAFAGVSATLAADEFRLSETSLNEVIPEPSTGLLVVLGLSGLLLKRRKTGTL